VQAVVVAGSTGEAGALSGGERVALVRAVRDAVDVPVVAGTGAASATQAVRLTQDAADAGADAVLALTPPGVADVRPYYDQVAAASSVPVLAYHYPSMSPPGIPLDVLPELPVAAVKDSSGEAERLLRQVATAGSPPVYVGSSALLLLAGAAGCPGAILALANAEPELCCRAFAGDRDAQRELIPSHLRAKGPAATKALAAERFPDLRTVSRI
jgi:4-hydroxy-tetrahydrodipicolinate synthase